MNIKLIREALLEGAEYIIEVSKYDSGISKDILDKMQSAFDETYKK